MNMIKVIFFDMGNTLLHFHYGKTDHEKDMDGLIYVTQYLNKLDKNIILDEVKNEFYNAWMEGIKDRKITYKEYPIEEFLNKFLHKYKINLTKEQCIEIINLFYTEYREQVYFEEDIYKILDKLKSKGYKIGIISNTCYYDEVMIECFKKVKIYNLIDSFTFSYSLRVGKPNKSIFIEALNKMNIAPEESVMVGDSLEKDIKPALDIGMNAILYNSKNHIEYIDNKPYKEINKISQLLNIL